MNSNIEGYSKEIPAVTISKIKFNDGTEIPLKDNDIILFVGANNVGKSRALKDIKDDLVESTKKKIIISEIQYSTKNFNNDNIKSFFERNYSSDKYNDGHYNIFIPYNNATFSYNGYNFNNVASLSKEFYKVFFSFLSTENRLNITAPISYNNMQDRFNLNIMLKLEKNESDILKLNKILLAGFGKAVDISNEYDNSTFSKKYKLGEQCEIYNTINSKRREANLKLAKLEDLHDQGDGIRSAVGILSSLIVNEHSLYLIDEPESFLHPPQARLLGNNIVELSEKKQCFISTHNIDLIRGILEKGSSRVKIIKIDRENNNNEFHILDNSSIGKIADDKNLKYTNILNGLFYNKVVLCENENDCKFYSAILENLNNKIYQSTLFCAVGGKDQFKVIIPLLRNLKINYSVIADIDLINNTDKLKQLINSIENDKYSEISSFHTDFLNQYEANTDSMVKKQITLKEEILKTFTNDVYMSDETANNIKNILKQINSLKLLKNGGIAILPQGSCIVDFNKINSFLKENNIFILECGELERFVPEIDKHGGAWVEEVFNKYPDINNNIYDNVKNFIRIMFKIS